MHGPNLNTRHGSNRTSKLLLLPYLGHLPRAASHTYTREALYVQGAD